MDIFDTEMLVIFFAWLGGLAAVVGIALPFLQRRSVSTRLKSVASRREELMRQQRERIREEQERRSARFQTTARVSLMKNILEKLKMANPMNSPELRDKMQRAGYRGHSAVVKYLFARTILPLVFAFVGLLLMSKTEMGGGGKVIWTVLAMAVGYYIPGLLVSNTIQKRQQEIKKAFPDAVDLLLICVEAGLSVEAAFSRVTEEMADGAPLLAEEMGLTAAELAFLPERRLAFENMASRIGLESAKSLATALVQSEKYGTPVAVALKVVSQESRDSRMAAAEKKAGALPAQLTVPMIAFFLPVLFIVIIGPAVIKIVSKFF